MKIYTKFVGIASFLVSTSVFANNSVILEDQLKSDLITLMKREAKNLGSDYGLPQFDLTKAQLEKTVDKSIDKIISKYPDRLTTTADEEAKLQKNVHIVSKKQLIESITKLRSLSLNPVFPKILEEYERLELRSELNPAQRLLAYRLSQSQITKVKQREQRFQK